MLYLILAGVVLVAMAVHVEWRAHRDHKTAREQEAWDREHGRPTGTYWP